jgi:hypothetical protein
MADMRGLLNPVPAGLLSLLELKQRGSNPDTLSGTVVPVLDLSHWYRNDQPDYLASSVDLVTATVYATILQLNNPLIIVPDGEIWWVREFGVHLELSETATDFGYNQFQAVALYAQTDLAAGVGRAQIKGPTIGQYGDPLLAGGMPAVGGIVASAESIRGFWAPPGMTFGAHFNGSAVDATNPPFISGFVQFDRLKI